MSSGGSERMSPGMKALRRSSVAAKRSSSAFMESFRAAVEDFDETDLSMEDQPYDALGVEIANALNSNPEFHRPLHWDAPGISSEDIIPEPTLRPLLSTRNWKWLQQQYRLLVKTIREDQSKSALGSLALISNFLFRNSKPIGGAAITFLGLGLLAVISLATASTFCTIWTLHFSWLITATTMAVLVDLREIYQSLPEQIQMVLSSLIPTVLWFDHTVLLGYWHQGREWSKDKYELNDGKKASSFSSYLRTFPPPSTKDGKETALSNKSIAHHGDWSQDSRDHAIAINFCYFMLREDFVKKQYSKLRKAVFKKRLPNIPKTSEEKQTSTDNSDKDGYLPDHNEFEEKKEVDMCDTTEQEACDDEGNYIPLEELNLEHIEKGQVDLTVLDGILDTDDESFDSAFDPHVIHEADSGTSADLDWMDVGAEIGMKILGSAAVQKAMTSHDTAERLVTIHANMNKAKEQEAESKISTALEAKNKTLPANVIPPVHSMWTSASAAAGSILNSPAHTIRTVSSGESEVQIIEGSEVETSTPPKDLPYLDMLPSSHQLKTPLVMEKSQPMPPPTSGITLRPKDHEEVPMKYDSIELVREKKRTSSSDFASIPPPKRRPQLLPGIKIAVPIFARQPMTKARHYHDLNFQMATVISSKRLSIFQKNKLPAAGKRTTNCLSITVQLDKSFLRNGKFAQMTLRIMDAWSDRFMPKHSKLPIGTCVSTSFGLGVLVGWRVEDDCHVVRSLWQRRGPGSACAYLQRTAIHSTVEAAIGFQVETTLGHGEVTGYVGGSEDIRSGRYVVQMADEGKHAGQTLMVHKKVIKSCKSARFIPVIEHVKEAVQYQLLLDTYNEAVSDEGTDPEVGAQKRAWKNISNYSDILWKSFLRATEEDDDFDEGMNAFISSLIKFFDRLDSSDGAFDFSGKDAPNIVITATDITCTPKHNQSEASEPSMWFMADVFGIFGKQSVDNVEPENTESIEVECGPELRHSDRIQRHYDRAFAVIRTLMRTVSIARTRCKDEPEFKLALSISYDFLVFFKTVVKVQQKNMSPKSLLIWRRAWDEVVSTFGPVKESLQKIGEGIAQRMEKQGHRAKIRLLRFVDTVVQDELLLTSVGHGDWKVVIEQLEDALVKAKIIDEESREHYHKTALFLYNQFVSNAAKNSKAAARNNEKLANLGVIIQWAATPKRSALRLLTQTWFLDALERVLVRVFYEQETASQNLTIHASNFHSLRQLRMLKDFTIAGHFWIPLLDAADAELAWLVSQMPQNAQEYTGPLSSLFSLCVAQFHKISEGDLTLDWLDFLLEDDAVSIIHDIDMRLILALESFSRDVREMMVVLPYYPSIEDDILDLVDEVDIDVFLREAADAVDDQQKLNEFIREKATIAIERFLDYLPKMAIPVEKRDLTDGWVLTCRGADGSDLTLTDLSIKRENLTCQVMGGDTLFFPMFGTDEEDSKSDTSLATPIAAAPPANISPSDTSVLDHIRQMILSAQMHGCWQEGKGGICQPPSDRYVASVLQGLPVSAALDCGIKLWRDLEIDDDELLEIAIRDVSYQIQLSTTDESVESSRLKAPSPLLPQSNDGAQDYVHKFNPRIDPSVLYLEIQKLTFHLDKFLFRIEKHEDWCTIFDPIFEGSGSLLVRNVSIKVRVDCVKSYTKHMGRKYAVPALQIRELEVNLEKVKLKVKDTGADWLLNKVVKSFEDSITGILAANLNEQVREQMDIAIGSLNDYCAVNPEIVLGMLDITIDDLEEQVYWV